MKGVSPGNAETFIVRQIYFPWSFIHIVLRLCLVSIYLARVNTYVNKLGDFLGDCPIYLYDGEVLTI